MFSFFSKKKISKDEVIDRLQIDLHSHLIPGIDDGAKTLEQSIELITSLANLGFKKLIITPHIMIDAYPNDEKDILNRLNILKLEIKKIDLDIQLEAAAEYYMDEGFLSHLENPLLINGEYLLFETSYMSKPMNMEELIYEIASRGYKPILAHPERYRYIKDLKKEYYRLKELGVYFQLDTSSLGGYYGQDAMEKATFLMNEGLVDFVGSDTHNKKHIKNLEKTLNEEKMWYNMFEKNTLLNKTLTKGDR